MLKSPFNWAGNKYYYLDQINSLNLSYPYQYVVDPFLGSGNLLLNLELNQQSRPSLVGSDIQKLIPLLYSKIRKQSEFSETELHSILRRWDYFTKKEDYYTFRDYWNKKYLDNIFDKFFCLETALLLKMCSNSMVRFNPSKGYFNQGFRGIAKSRTGKSFFRESTLEKLLQHLNSWGEHLKQTSAIFLNGDFRQVIEDYLEKVTGSHKVLFILDPPYIVGQSLYDSNFSQEKANWLLNFIETTNHDYLYFNYLMDDGNKNLDLEVLTHRKEVRVQTINSKVLAGQNRSRERKVNEVLISKITEGVSNVR